MDAVLRPSAGDASEPSFDAALRFAREGRFDDAIAAIERALSARASDEPFGSGAAAALGQVARAASAAGDAAAAGRALERALALRPGFADLHFQRARLLLAQHRGADARRSLDEALRIHPRYAAARVERALLDASEGFVGEALAALRALARECRVEEPRTFERGLESLEQADWESASELIGRALRLDDAGLEASVAQARAALDEGQPARAAQLLRGLLPARAAFPDVHALLGSAELAQGHLDDAIASFARALELHPGFHAARVQLARALEAQGASAQAVEQLGLVLAAEPEHVLAQELHDRWTARRPRSSGRTMGSRKGA